MNKPCPHCGGLHFGQRFDDCPYVLLSTDTTATPEQRKNAAGWLLNTVIVDWVPPGTVMFMPQDRLPNETNEEFIRRCAVITGLQIPPTP